MLPRKVKDLMKENIVRGPWTRHMSLDDFYHRADQYLAAILERQKSLTSTYKLLRVGKGIHANHNKQIISLIYTLGEPIQNFCQLLETPAELPEPIIPLRYLLAIALCDVDEQVSELIPVVTKFRKSKNQDLESRLCRLIKSCSDVKEEYQNLAERLLPSRGMTDRFLIGFVS
jgi:hypothetical protein